MSLADSLQDIRNTFQDFDWNDIDFNKAGSWPLPLRIASFVLVAVLTLLIGFWWVISEQRSSLAKEVSQEAKLKQQFETKWTQSSSLDSYDRQLKEMKSLFGDLLRQLPTDTEVPGLLEDITAAGHASNLEFESIKLLPEEERDFYVELPIEIVADGNYHDLATFVGAVANMPRIVTLHDFNIVLKEAKSFRRDQKPDPNHLRMTITAKTYRYKDQGSNS